MSVHRKVDALRTELQVITMLEVARCAWETDWNKVRVKWSKLQKESTIAAKIVTHTFCFGQALRNK